MKADRQMSALERRINDLDKWKLKLNDEKDEAKIKNINESIRICESDIHNTKKNLHILPV